MTEPAAHARENPPPSAIIGKIIAARTVMTRTITEGRP
jgi:hypothetical protein